MLGFFFLFFVYSSIVAGGVCEGLVRSSYPVIALSVTVLVGLRHLSNFSPLNAMIRLVVDVAIVYAIIIGIILLMILYLAVFVPDAFSH